MGRAEGRDGPRAREPSPAQARPAQAEGEHRQGQHMAPRPLQRPKPRPGGLRPPGEGRRLRRGLKSHVAPPAKGVDGGLGLRTGSGGRRGNFEGAE